MSARLTIVFVTACCGLLLQTQAHADAFRKPASTVVGRIPSAANSKQRVNQKFAHQRVVPKNRRTSPDTTKSQRPVTSRTKPSFLADTTPANRFASPNPRDAASSISTRERPATAAIQSPNGVRSKSPTINNSRHRNPNPAIVNGSTNSVSKNAGVLDGTRMNRKL